jgi:hypothetical protein
MNEVRHAESFRDLSVYQKLRLSRLRFSKLSTVREAESEYVVQEDQ